MEQKIALELLAGLLECIDDRGIPARDVVEEYERDELSLALSTILKTFENKPDHRHIKRGSTYQILNEGTLQLPDPKFDDSPVVIYRDAEGKWWVRLTEEFNDGRFEPV